MIRSSLRRTVGTTTGTTTRRAFKRPALIAAGAVLAAGTSVMAGALPSQAASPASGTIDLVAYSTPAPAYGALIRAFNKTPQGKHVTVLQSYRASGSQAKAVIAGQPADVVNFSTQTDMESLVSRTSFRAIGTPTRSPRAWSRTR